MKQEMQKLHFECADESEVESRRRAIKQLIGVLEPDPSYQPAFISDHATLLDLLGYSEEELQTKLRTHFDRLDNVDLREPIWKVVDQLEHQLPTGKAG